jgi:sulfhydrogenase subunit beta (sulfur reductase)
MLYLNRGNTEQLIEALGGEFSVLFPAWKSDQLYFSTPEKDEVADVEICGARTVDPLKAFFFRCREKVANGFSPEVPNEGVKPLCIVGAKACDLKGFSILDYVFMDPEYGDPTYRKLRESCLIISSDCTSALETCFCLSVDVKPYPVDGFDLNLSPVDDGYIVETGSEKGRSIVRKYQEFFIEPTAEQVAQRQRNRTAIIDEVTACIEEADVPSVDLLEGRMKRNFESTVWADEAATCVECGACNTICPTCHCFLLYDQESDGRHGRFRIWDSCLVKDFARVAGGDNPRGALWKRLRNRFDKKFDYFHEVAGQYACTGCGRCITACPGKIDIRRILKRLVSNG